MPVADARRIDAFTRWSNERGLVARDVDRARVARELFEISDGAEIETHHIDVLLKKYREGLMGARSVLAAKRVGQELLEWQEESLGDEPEDEIDHRPPPRRDPSEPRVVSRQRRDPSEPRAAPSARRDPSEPRAAASNRLPSNRLPDVPARQPSTQFDRPLDPRDEDSWPDLEPVPSKKTAPRALPSSPPPASARPPRAAPVSSRPPASSTGLPSLDEHWGDGEQFTPSGVNQEQYSPAPRKEGARSAPPKTAPWAGEFALDKPRSAPPRSSPPRARSERPHTGFELDDDREVDIVAHRSKSMEERVMAMFQADEPRRGPSSRPPSKRPSNLDDDRERFSSRPPPRSSSMPPKREPSGRTGGLGDIELDDEPRKYKQGFDKTPSVRPGAKTLDANLDRDESEEIDQERKLRARVDPEEPVAAPALPPKSARPSPLLLPDPEPAPLPFTIPSRIVAIVFAVIVGSAVAALFIFRPGCIFASSAKPVEGTFVSKHLGVAWDFPEQWLYAEDRDAHEVKDGWQRSSSVFFRGQNPQSFTSQIVVIAFEQNGKPAVPEDARQLGANETLDHVMRRRCDDIELRAGVPAVECFVITMRPGQPLGVIEIYFALDGRALFLRFSFEIPQIMPAANPQDNEQQQKIVEQQLTSQAADALKLVRSLRTLPK